MLSEPVFLTLDEVQAIHLDQIHRYGGESGLRDLGLLRSALAQPEASFGGQWLHDDLFLMAAAYAFHVALNHPFVDGNKRVAAVCALYFLALNGYESELPVDLLVDEMLAIAEGRSSKPRFADMLRLYARPRPG